MNCPERDGCDYLTTMAETDCFPGGPCRWCGDTFLLRAGQHGPGRCADQCGDCPRDFTGWIDESQLDAEEAADSLARRQADRRLATGPRLATDPFDAWRDFTF
jgi:hypothetical protein